MSGTEERPPSGESGRHGLPELIAERRAAGIYGPKRHRKQMLVTMAGLAAGLAVIVFLIV